jgi:hypothetical protein
MEYNIAIMAYPFDHDVLCRRQAEFCHNAPRPAIENASSGDDHPTEASHRRAEKSGLATFTIHGHKSEKKRCGFH